MSNWALPHMRGAMVTIGADTSDSAGVTVAAGVRTLGSWVEMISSIPTDIGPIRIHFQDDGGDRLAADRGMYELGLGAAGSEETVFSGYFSSHGVIGGASLEIPVRLPAGERLAIRASNQSIETYSVTITAHGASDLQDFYAVSSDLEGTIDETDDSTLYGAGVEVDPGGTANTKSSWVEMIASTSGDYRKFQIIPITHDASLDNASMLFDVAVGGAGSEQIILEDQPMSSVVTDVAVPNGPLTFDMPIPSGTRVAIRMQSSTTDAVNRLMQFGFLGLR